MKTPAEVSVAGFEIAPIPGERETTGYEPFQGREIRKQWRVVD